jgi:hypothetical protein
VTEHELPPDPDLDDLPDAIAEAEGPLTLTGVEGQPQHEQGALPI